MARLQKFCVEDDGAALVETIIITPVIVILLAGLLEFGAFLVYKVELETGLRDAARYIARCQDAIEPPAAIPTNFGCSDETAQRIAASGSPTGDDGRVPGWSYTNVVIEDPPTLINNPFDPTTGLTAYRGPLQLYIVRVSTEFDYTGGPLLSFIGFASIHMAAFHEERFVGW